MSADESVESLIERCAQEPIRTPGSIQPWGTLLAFGLEDGRIHYHAENAPDFLGVESDLLGRSARKLPGVSDPMIQAPSSHHRTEWETGEDTVLRVRQWTDGNWGFLEYLPDSPPTESDIFQLQEEVEALIATTEISELLDRGVRHLQDLTGYDQVMAYRFRRSLDGEVVAETISGDRPSFEGHRFPASDIPSQARSLYLEQRFRIIPDRRYEAVPIRGLHEEPLDLSGSRLRSVSPVHLQYLANMGVRASPHIPPENGKGRAGLL